MDLISSLQKVLDTTSDDNMATKRRSTVLSDQGKNEMNMKVEKLQEELTNLDSQLFELEKKYGEFKIVKKEIKPVQVSEKEQVKSVQSEEQPEEQVVEEVK